MVLHLLRSLRKIGSGVRADAVSRRAGAQSRAGTDADALSYKQLNHASDTIEPNHSTDGSGEIDVWVVPSRIMPELARSMEALSDEEREHAAKINHKHHRIRYIAVRSALRFALSHRFQNALSSRQWRISTPPFGKPQVCSDQANCSFSITHADEFSVIAIAPEHTVGIDAERLDAAKLKHMPMEFLSANEQERLNAKARDDQYYDFFRFWTLKEAYTKAVGMGLSLDFGEIEFDLADDPASNGTTAIDDEQYELMTLKYLEFEHLLAICLLGVAREDQRAMTKNLYIVEPPASAQSDTTAKLPHTGETEPMTTPMQIIDTSNPERIELYGLEDLPELLHESIEEQVETAPEHTALEINGETVTYRELNDGADEIAAYLLAKGIETGDMVAVYQTTTADLFMSMLGVLKAGAVYVPVDPNASSQIAADVISQHHAKMVLTCSNHVAELHGRFTGKLVVVDQDRQKFKAFAKRANITAQAPSTNDPSHIAFKPQDGGPTRSVVVSHGDAVKFAHSLAAVYGIEAGHRCFQDAELAFDVAVEEAWAMLSAGATVVIETADAAGDEYFAERGINVVSTTPDNLEGFEADLPGVDIMIVGGRPCGSALAVKWALRTGRIVSIKRDGDRFPSFSIEQESGAAWRPRMLPPHAADLQAA